MVENEIIRAYVCVSENVLQHLKEKKENCVIRLMLICKIHHSSDLLTS